MPAVQGDMSEFNKFTYYFTSAAGGRVTPKGSNEDGFEVTPKGLEDIATGATISPESLGGQTIDEAQRTDFPNGIQVGGTASLQDVTISGTTTFSTQSQAKTTRAGAVRLASIAQLTATGSSAAVAGTDAAMEAAPDAVTISGLNRWRQAQGLVSSLSGTITIFVKGTATDRNLASMLDRPPTTIADAIPTLARAAEYANALIGPGNQTAEIRIAPGLYDPSSTWQCNVRFVAYNEALTTPIWASNSVGTDTVANNHFNGSGYADYANSVNFWSMRLGVRDATVSGSDLQITIQPRSMRFNRGVDWEGGFHFLGLNEIIKAVGEARIPIASFLTDVANLMVLADFTSNLTSNVDTLLSRIRAVYRPTATSYDSFSLNSLIRLSASATDIVSIDDCVFGPGLPSRKDSIGGARPPLIEIDGAATLILRNVYIRGKTTITSAGIGVSGALPLANNTHYGNAAVNTPWTWEQTYHTFIGRRTDRLHNISLEFGGFFNVDTVPGLGSSRSYYVDRTGKLLPNHIHLLDNSGAAPSDNNTGPFFDQFIHAPSRLYVGIAWRGASESQSQTTGNRLQGFVGRFGSNGYNSVKTRGVLGGNAGAYDPETGFVFELASGVGSNTGRTFFQRAGLTPAEASSASLPTFNASSTAAGDGFPTGLNPVITTDTSGSAALNVALRSYLRGISTSNAITIPATNVIL